MTSFTLKIIALITMFIDHLGYAIFNKFSFFNYIGRVAFPIFAFQISEGFHYTKNVKKYFARLLLFAMFSQIPFMLFLSIFSNNIYKLNVFFTLFLGLFSIYIYDKIINSFYITSNVKLNNFLKFVFIDLNFKLEPMSTPRIFKVEGIKPGLHNLRKLILFSKYLLF